MRFGFVVLASLLGSFSVACSASSSGTSGGGGGGGGATTATGAGGSGADTSTSAGSGGSGGVDIGTGGSGGGGEMAPAEVFAQSASTLYKLDPLTKAVTTVGSFQGCDGSVIDIALDKDGAMFATTFGGLYAVDKTTAKCTFVASGSYPNSLSFVPKGTLDANEEALVGYEGDTYVRIDEVSGQITNVGSLGGGYSSSGDVVSVIGGGTYLTVNGNGCGDCIVEVNPKTGALVSMIGPVGHGSVFGLAFWGGSAYGFDDAGELFEIDLKTAQATIIPMPSAPPNLSFWGAGSSTSAPLVRPK